MPSFLLTDAARDGHVPEFETSAAELGLPAPAPFRVAKTTLKGGRREGVERIEVDNGALAFTVLPTRGMGIGRATARGDRVGWDSPVADGPVHPSLVDLQAWGGLVLQDYPRKPLPPLRPE